MKLELEMRIQEYWMRYAALGRGERAFVIPLVNRLIRDVQNYSIIPEFVLRKFQSGCLKNSAIMGACITVDLPLMPLPVMLYLCLAMYLFIVKRNASLFQRMPVTDLFLPIVLDPPDHFQSDIHRFLLKRHYNH